MSLNFSEVLSDSEREQSITAELIEHTQKLAIQGTIRIVVGRLKQLCDDMENATIYTIETDRNRKTDDNVWNNALRQCKAKVEAYIKELEKEL